MSSEKSAKYVNSIIEAMRRNDKALRSKLRRADNDATEYQCWNFLARWVDLEWVSQRKAYALVAAALARTRVQPVENGSIGLGKGLFLALKEAMKSTKVEDRESTRLRRILACEDVTELIAVLRPVLRFLDSKGITLDYARLLDEVLWFDREKSRERSKAQWAGEFYATGGSEN